MRTEQQLEDRAWGIAFGHFLSDYPDNASPDEIMELIKDDSNEIMVWEPFFLSAPDWLAEQVLTMKELMLSELLWATE